MEDNNLYSNTSRYDFTGFRDTKIKVEEPLLNQLNKELKKMLYSRRKSAKEFYAKADEDDNYETVTEADYEED